MIKKIMIVILLCVIGFNFNMIKTGVVEQVHKSMHIQYCNDMYLGNSEKINACMATD